MTLLNILSVKLFRKGRRINFYFFRKKTKGSIGIYKEVPIEPAGLHEKFSDHVIEDSFVRRLRRR